MAFPEQPELDELESALDAPPNATLRCPHPCTPVSWPVSGLYSTSFWLVC